MGIASLVVALVASGAAPTVAVADEQPSILKAYGLDWIERVKEEAWPQPKAERPVLCLLDTGVDITPDTPADHPDGPIVARLALDGGTGFSQGEGHPYNHGTQMASIIAAPRNDWGTVGVFPQARIVSVRVTEGTEAFMTPADIVRGVWACGRWALGRNLRVGAVVIAESNYSQREADETYWKRATDPSATGDGLLLAAVGNDASASQPVPPLGIPRIVPVLAADGMKQACTFSPKLEKVSVLSAPGCGVGPWPSGSSAASAVSGAVAAAWITAVPDVETRDVRAHFLQGASPATALDGEGFRSRVAAWISPEVIAATASVNQTIISVGSEAAAGPRTTLWKPRLRVRWHKGRLQVERRDRRGGRLYVRVPGKAASQLSTDRAGRAVLTVKRRVRHVDVWAVGKSGGWRSLTVRVQVV